MDECISENWKDIPMLAGFQASDSGSIRDSRNGKQRKMFVNSRGYCFVRINNKYHRVHRLVALAHLQVPEKYRGIRPCRLQVNHIDGNTQNNSASNLEWSTNSDNQIHRYRVMGKSNRKKAVQKLDMDTGAVLFTYESICQAERLNGYPVHSISDACTGRKTSYGGYRWRYC